MRPNPVSSHKQTAHRQIQPPSHDDAYRLDGKFAEPTACPDCHAVYHKGRWQWLAAPQDAKQKRCPACQRIHDDYPSGCIAISGPFFMEHRKEIMQLIHNVADYARQEHPLKRLMKNEERGDGTVLLQTTDAHLARQLGESLHSAYQGQLDFDYASAEDLLRVSWRR